MRVIRYLLPALALTIGSVVSAPAAAAAPATDYVVALHDTAGDPGAVATGYVRRYGGTVGHVYRHALRGFSATLDQEAAAAPRVRSVSVDAPMRSTEQTVPTGIDRTFATDNPNLRINGQDDFSADVDVAVIDTGVAQHTDLTVAARADCVSANPCSDGSGTDDNGHGTHVAGTIAARDDGAGVVGMAPGARIWSAKVLNSSGSGSIAGVAAGVDWVAAHADEIEVANLSLGCDGCDTDVLNQAISTAIGKGVVFAVAAGNNHKDARTFSPANHPDVVTVSALADFNGSPGGGAGSTCRADQDDTLADFSNFGATVEIAAPGVCILSTARDGGYTTLSGTSMAAPHVAGAAGLLTANVNRATNRDEVLAIRQQLIDTGNTAWRDDSGDGSTEPLLDVSSTADYPAGIPDPGRPTAAFTATCSTDNTTCSFDAGTSTDQDGTIASYEWDFGDGGTATGKTTRHTYQKAANYSVRLKVTDDDGKTHTTRRLVKAGDLPPTAAFSGNCGGARCSFDGSGSSDQEGPISSYSWNFGDGSTATGRTAAHAYPNETKQYTVRLTVTDSKNQTASTSKTVNCHKVVNSPICFLAP